VSYLVSNEDGRDVETVLVGREGAVGGIVSLGHLPAYCRIMVKYPGPMAQLRINVLQEAKSKSSSLRSLFARYADCLLAQIFRSTACNAIHSVEQRLARWLLMAQDRMGSDEFPLTQEFVAIMLGAAQLSRVIRHSQNIREIRRGVTSGSRLRCAQEAGLKCNESGALDIAEGAYPDDAADAMIATRIKMPSNDGEPAGLDQRIWGHDLLDHSHR
jgi:hypothetical protein